LVRSPEAIAPNGVGEPGPSPLRLSIPGLGLAAAPE
jgi:hypothetical protein